MRIKQKSDLEGHDSSSEVKRCQNDAHVGFEVFCDFASSLINILDDFNHDLQAFAGMGLFHQLFDQSDAGKDHALTGVGYMGKQAVLNRIVLGAIGRIMRNVDLDFKLINQFLEVFFEDGMVGIVTATAISQSQAGRCLGISRPPGLDPPGADTIAGELAGILAGA